MLDQPRLRIAVLAALGRNPVSGAARPNPDDLLALDIALQLSSDVTLLHVGTDTETALGDYFAYGAINLLVVPAGPDIAAQLAERLSGYDLILTGTRSEGGQGSGMVPYLVAEQRGLPIVAQALDLSIANGHVEITQSLPKGQRRHVRVSLPAVVAIHPKAPAKPRYAFARRAHGRLLQVPSSGAAPATVSAWRTEPAIKRPVKFKAAETKSGHARMLSAVATDAKGGAVISSGTPAEKAQAILFYLREHKLIDW
ncbi:hypothetical protein [Devosia sp.]|uniref:hypothetical protein n=1 Tax=Devosia sp. TaxID=1871048 RepID=UPI0032662379